MRLITSKDEDLLPSSDEMTKNIVIITSLIQIVIKNLDLEINKGKTKWELPLEHVFGFCKTFEKISKNLGFQLTFKTANLQDKIYKILGDDIKLAINNITFFLPYLFQMPKHKPCLMNLQKMFFRFLMTLGISIEYLLTMV